MFDLSDKVAIITGGAGALGEAIAQGLAAYGADIVVTGRTMKTLERAVKLVEDVGRKALAVTCDVASEADVVRLVDETLKTFGRIDILVTVAGLAKRHPAEDFPVEDFDQVIDINVRVPSCPASTSAKCSRSKAAARSSPSRRCVRCRPSGWIRRLRHQQGRRESAHQAVGDRVGKVSH